MASSLSVATMAPGKETGLLPEAQEVGVVVVGGLAPGQVEGGQSPVHCQHAFLQGQGPAGPC